MKLLAAIILGLLLSACSFDSSTEVDDEPWCITRRRVHRDLYLDFVEYTDTVAMIRYPKDPRYQERSTVEIKYILDAKVNDSFSLCFDCNNYGGIDWITKSYSWYGDYDIFDTLVCEFEFIPLVTGTVGYDIAPIVDGVRHGRLHYGYTLSESGRFVPGNLGGPIVYGVNGPLPDAMNDTLYAYMGTLCEHEHRRAEAYVEAILTPPLSANVVSRLEFRIVPACKSACGLCWELHYSDNLGISIDGPACFQGDISPTDTLKLRFKVTPLKEGYATIELKTEACQQFMNEYLVNSQKQRGTCANQRICLHMIVDDAKKLRLFSYRGISRRPKLDSGSSDSMAVTNRANEAARYRLNTSMNVIRCSEGSPLH